jgi:hypothetical protein
MLPYKGAGKPMVLKAMLSAASKTQPLKPLPLLPFHLFFLLKGGYQGTVGSL